MFLQLRMHSAHPVPVFGPESLWFGFQVRLGREPEHRVLNSGPFVWDSE